MYKIDKEKHFISFNMDDNIINMFLFKPFNFNFDLVSPDEIDRQYEEIQEMIGYKFKKIVKGHQKHSNNVVIINENNMDDYFENTDGLLTDLDGVALITKVADCQSIFLYDPVKGVIGNVHSGWKGTVNKIVGNAIHLMIDNYGCNVNDIQVYICPSISGESFEVDEDVKGMFVDSFNDINISKYIVNKGVKYYIDTVGINREYLISLGLDNSNIFNTDLCTLKNCDMFHSYRKDKEKSGRNLALICKKR